MGFPNVGETVIVVAAHHAAVQNHRSAVVDRPEFLAELRRKSQRHRTFGVEEAEHMPVGRRVGALGPFDHSLPGASFHYGLVSVECLRRPRASRSSGT